MDPKELAKLIDKLPSRDQRVLHKLIERMVEWHLTLPRAIANATVYFEPSGGDQEFESFERSLDWWIDAGKRYG